MKPDLADFIKTRMNEIPGMSFRKLEVLSGVSRSEISYLINRKRIRPRPEILQAIAPHLKVKYEFLLFVAGYLSKETWTLIEGKAVAKHQWKISKQEIPAEPGDVYHSLGLLSLEERDLLVNFRKIRDPEAKTFLAFFVRIALKADQVGQGRD